MLGAELKNNEFHQMLRSKTRSARWSDLSLVALIFAMYGCTGSEGKNNEPKFIRPNVLFLIVDDLRPELGAYGASHIHSPNIDKLASRSVLFERAYVNYPVCGASRASFLTGLRPTQHRFNGYKARVSVDVPNAVSLPMYFKENDYHTLSYGKVYHFADDDTLAWDEIWRPEYLNKSTFRDYQGQENLALIDTLENWTGPFKSALPYESEQLADSVYFDGRLAEKAIGKLRGFKKGDPPFFMALGFFKPHLPFNAPAKYWELYDSAEIDLPANYSRPKGIPDEAYHTFGELRHYQGIPPKGDLTDEMAKRLIHGYYASISYVDAQVGKVLKATEDLGFLDNTVIVLIGDHGWNLGDHKLWCKHCNFESSLHTPLIIKAPDQKPGKVKSIVEFVDIYPSLLELAHLPQKEDLDGESVVPLLNGNAREKNYAISKYWSGVTHIEGLQFYTEWIDDSLRVRANMLFEHKNDSLELNNIIDELTSEEVSSLSEKLRSRWGKDFYNQNHTN